MKSPADMTLREFIRARARAEGTASLDHERLEREWLEARAHRARDEERDARRIAEEIRREERRAAQEMEDWASDSFSPHGRKTPHGESPDAGYQERLNQKRREHRPKGEWFYQAEEGRRRARERRYRVAEEIKERRRNRGKPEGYIPEREPGAVVDLGELIEHRCPRCDVRVWMQMGHDLEKGVSCAGCGGIVDYERRPVDGFKPREAMALTAGEEGTG